MSFCRENTVVNFSRDVLERLPADHTALLELARDGSRRSWTFAEVGARSASLAGSLRARGVGRGDVVMTLIGNRPEWVLAMCACFHLGAVVLPCTEQLRAKDLRARIAVAAPSLILADELNQAQLESALAPCRQGAMNTLRADLLQPEAAVHHTSSPARACSQ